MSRGVGKKIGDFVLNGISLKRRTKISDAGLVASQGVNMDRITNFILYKSHKAYAMRNYGMKLDDVQSVKEITWSESFCTKAKATKVAYDIVNRYSSSIAMEKISDATLKASNLFNRIGEENTKWGNIADMGFKPVAHRLDDHDFNCSYVNEVFGIPKKDLEYLALYADRIFKIEDKDATTMAVQVIAFEKIVEAAFKASHTLTEKLHNREKTAVAEDDPSQMRRREVPPSLSYDLSPFESWEAGFMKSRDERSIFADSEEASRIYRVISHIWWSGSSCNINWERMTRFMEFKARKEYAMEIYGARLGDFHSLKETALKLFEITESQARGIASFAMDRDSESIAFEKIADAVFKASKILNWRSGNEERQETWRGNIGDASGFKSPKCMSHFCGNMDLEARKAYTMEAFGVNAVDIDYIKDFAVDVFMRYNSETLDARNAVIMACQTVAIDHVVDAVSKNLSLPLQLEAIEAKEARAMPNKGLPVADFFSASLLEYSKTEAQSDNDTKTDTQSDSNTRTDTQSDSNTRTDIQSEFDFETDTLSDTSSETDAQSDSDSETNAQSESDSETVAQSDSGSGTDTQSESESDSETDAQSDSSYETDTQSDSYSESDSQSESDSETDARSNSGSETDTQSDSGSESDTQSASDSETDTQSDSGSKSDAKSNSDSVSDTQSESDSDSVSDDARSSSTQMIETQQKAASSRTSSSPRGLKAIKAMSKQNSGVESGNTCRSGGWKEGCAARETNPGDMSYEAHVDRILKDLSKCL